MSFSLHPLTYFIVTGGSPAHQRDAATMLQTLTPGVMPQQKLWLGIRVGEELVGMVDCILHHPKHAEAFIGLLLVSEEHQGQGLGRSLHEALVRELSSRGITRILLGIVDFNKTTAEPFWLALGYSPTGNTSPYSHGSITSVSRQWSQYLPTSTETRRQ